DILRRNRLEHRLGVNQRGQYEQRHRQQCATHEPPCCMHGSLRMLAFPETSSRSRLEDDWIVEPTLPPWVGIGNSVPSHVSTYRCRLACLIVYCSIELRAFTAIPTWEAWYAPFGPDWNEAFVPDAACDLPTDRGRAGAAARQCGERRRHQRL